MLCIIDEVIRARKVNVDKEEVMIDKTAWFTTSIDLSNHPMRNVKTKLKKQYYLTLEYFIKKQLDNKYTASRLVQYREKFLSGTEITGKEVEIKDIVQSIINSKFQPWRNKYRYWILCDAALIFMDDELIRKTAMEMKTYMSKRQQEQFEVLLNAFRYTNVDIEPIIFAEEMIKQYRKNRNFSKSQIHKYIVTANMSAGKSTLINALVGKSLAKTSQEVCTSNICYLYNKPYEDGRIHLQNSEFTNNATPKELESISWEFKTSIASYFTGIDDIDRRLCIIDTPGVNSAINRNHGRISRQALKCEEYEKVIYVLNANKLGTDEEIAHLKWISDNVPKDKVIFVLNKLDDFKIVDDNILASIEGVKRDLILIGFENPVVCPISAYFALLIKMKANGNEFTEDEMDEYLLYIKKFRKTSYDLSKYYDGIYEEVCDNEIVAMSKKCGLYGLEKILFGGAI